MFSLENYYLLLFRSLQFHILVLNIAWIKGLSNNLPLDLHKITNWFVVALFVELLDWTLWLFFLIFLLIYFLNLFKMGNEGFSNIYLHGIKIRNYDKPPIITVTVMSSFRVCFWEEYRSPLELKVTGGPFQHLSREISSPFASKGCLQYYICGINIS